MRAECACSMPIGSVDRTWSGNAASSIKGSSGIWCALRMMSTYRPNSGLVKAGYTWRLRDHEALQWRQRLWSAPRPTRRHASSADGVIAWAVSAVMPGV